MVDDPERPPGPPQDPVFVEPDEDEEEAAPAPAAPEEGAPREQLELIQRTQGIVLKPVPLPPWEVYESCDRCERFLVPMETYFDGRQFLCPECRAEAR